MDLLAADEQGYRHVLHLPTGVRFSFFEGHVNEIQTERGTSCKTRGSFHLLGLLISSARPLSSAERFCLHNISNNSFAWYICNDAQCIYPSL